MVYTEVLVAFCLCSVAAPAESAPNFTASCAPQTTPETANDNVARLTATGGVNYFIVSQDAPGNPFTINKTTGVLSMAEIDIDGPTLNTVFNLTITANDGTVNATTPCKLQVTIIDINDNPPIFKQADYNVVLAAPVIKGKSVLNITSTDQDKTPANAQVNFYVLNGTNSGNFSIDTNGKITAGVNITSATNYNLGIIATDSGSPPLTGYAKLTICVGPCGRGGGNGIVHGTASMLVYFLVGLFLASKTII